MRRDFSRTRLSALPLWFFRTFPARFLPCLHQLSLRDVMLFGGATVRETLVRERRVDGLLHRLFLQTLHFRRRTVRILERDVLLQYRRAMLGRDVG